MKVLMGTFSGVTMLGGGVEVQVRSLQRELVKLGVEAELFDPWKSYDRRSIDLFHLFAANVGTYHLGRALHSLGVKLAVSPVFFSRHNAAAVARRLAVGRKLRRVGGLWTEHMFCKELCDMAQVVLPNTQAELELVRDAFEVPAEKLRVLPNGVDGRFAGASPDAFVAQFGIRDFVLYVGHIGWERKNVLPLVKVLLELDRPAVFIGTVIDNRYGRQCYELIRGSASMRHIPALPPGSELLASAYAAAHVLVLPAYYETPGLAALEAALAGTRICITRHGGTTEYFGDMADYLEPSEPASIRNALRSALSRPKDQGLREHVRTNYLWSHAGQRLLATYRQTLA
jgi:glycosyltransferase involved in cell wall biosynthesis